jgi:hypothetical protein
MWPRQFGRNFLRWGLLISVRSCLSNTRTACNLQKTSHLELIRNIGFEMAKRITSPKDRSELLIWFDDTEDSERLRIEWEQRARNNMLALSGLYPILPGWWPQERRITTREEYISELVRIIWTARHNPDETATKAYIEDSLLILSDLLAALVKLGRGEVVSFLQPQKIKNRPASNTADLTLKAILAAAFAALKVVGVSKDTATAQVARLVKRKPAISSRMVYRYWRQFRGTLEVQFLTLTILSNEQCKPSDFNAKAIQKSELLRWGASHRSVIRQTEVLLDRFFAWYHPSSFE